MKIALTLFLFMTSTLALAESLCDIRIGHSVGVQVVEFASGHVVHSKMALKEMSSSSLTEELISLQDMGVCEEKIITKKCILKLEKKQNTNQLTLFRGQDRWLSWQAKAKIQAVEFVKNLQRAGFCS